MEEEDLLLRHVCETAAMGRLTTQHLQKLLPPGEFSQQIGRQYEEYDEICQQALDLLWERQLPPRRVPAVSRRMAVLMMEAAFWRPHTRSRLAQMVLQGNLAGVKKTRRFLRETEEKAEDKITALAKKLLKTQESNTVSMLRYV